ncbi:MAG: nthA [Rhodospirillales bacterium]|nr:nthA [Rhodospirillales bacterium]
MSDHDHSHAEDHTTPPPEIQLRIKAMESLLVEMGVIDPAMMDAVVDFYERQVGPRNGARIVARAWADPTFKARLLKDPKAAIAELAMPGISGDHLVMVENRPGVHNMIVCTLCSCYPWQTMGLPPIWFKSAAYRSRAVSHPRDVLAEFGVAVPPETAIKVWDSNADIRYMVLPERPAGTDHMTEADLADLVTRDSMIGTALPLAPAKAAP